MSLFDQFDNVQKRNVEYRVALTRLIEEAQSEIQALDESQTLHVPAEKGPLPDEDPPPPKSSGLNRLLELVGDFKERHSDPEIDA